MANFAHAQPRPLWTDCNQILHVGLGRRWKVALFS